jgi:hypothetical protein
LRDMVRHLLNQGVAEPGGGMSSLAVSQNFQLDVALASKCKS